MPTYYDPITLENLEIDDTVVLYLIQIDDRYSLKGVSSQLDQLPHDPHTQAMLYWLVNVTTVLENNHVAENREIIFPNNQLTTVPLSLSIVIKYLNCNPMLSQPQTFNRQMRQVLLREWSDNILSTMPDEMPSVFVDIQQSRQNQHVIRRPMPLVMNLPPADDEDSWFFTATLREQLLDIDSSQLADPNILQQMSLRIPYSLDEILNLPVRIQRVISDNAEDILALHNETNMRFQDFLTLPVDRCCYLFNRADLLIDLCQEVAITMEQLAALSDSELRALLIDSSSAESQGILSRVPSFHS